MKKALLIIDVQNDFVTGSLGSEYARDVVVPNIVELAKQFNKKDIYFTLDTHGENYLLTQEGIKLPIKHCIVGTEGHRLVKELDKFILKGQLNKALHIIVKDRFGAFQTDFYNMFYKPYMNIGYDEIHICGLVTDICVISNALILKSTFPWIKIVVHENCCGGTSKEAHDAAILVMKSCQIDIE